MVIQERDGRNERLKHVAELMMVAARTAPKGKGFDIIEVAMVTDESITLLSEMMMQISEESGMKFFIRDAGNISQSGAVVLIGTRQLTHGLNCAYCGYDTCSQKPPKVPCALNSTDVGIAIGSACSVAADMRVDSRVMFSAGKAAERLGWLAGCSQVYAIPISCSSKSPFFDRVMPK